jgi:RNA polymerase sigma factor (sigma-70 family)
MSDTEPSSHRASSSAAGQVTQLLDAIGSGDASDEQLLPLVYDELRRLAAARLSREAPNQTLQPTALVHEAYLRILGPDPPPDSVAADQGSGADQPNQLPEAGRPARWDSRGHFFAAAAEAMRRILVENARRKQRIRHGGGRQRIDLDEADLPVESPSDDIIALDEALTRLAAEDKVKADLVKLRYYAGLTVEEAARILNISRVSAHRYWVFARAWLYEELFSDGGSPPC